MATTGRPQYAAYLRISKDPFGTSTAPERQLEDIETFAKLKGFELAHVYEDRDTSAYSEDVTRPGYEALLDDVSTGRFDGVVVWKLDRLIRRITEFSRFWKVATESKTQLVSVNDPIDTREPIGVAFVYLLVGLAEQEAHNMGLRIRRRVAEDVKQGVRHAGGRRGFGMTRDGQIIEEEAAVIREAAQRLLAGESPSSITRDFNARGTTTANGHLWTRRGLTNLMVQARLFGYREHHGDLAGKGDWPAILDEATGRALRDLLPPKSHVHTRQKRERTTLFSGMLRCGKCGHAMKANRRTDGAGLYACPPLSEGGCSGTVISRDAVEEALTEMILYRLESPALLAAAQERRGSVKAQDDTALLAELAALDQRKDDAADMFANGELDRTGYARTMRALDEETAEVNRRLSESVKVEPLEALLLSEGSFRGAWQQLPISRQRAVAEILLESVIVHPKTSPYFLERLERSLAAEIDQLQPELERVTAVRDALSAARSGPELTAEQRDLLLDCDDVPDVVKRYVQERRSEPTAAQAKALVAARDRATRRRQDVRDKITRRRQAIKNGASMGPQFRPERLEPKWRI